MFRLLARYRDDVRAFAVRDGRFRLGASGENDYVLPFPGVSRRHAVVIIQGGSITLEDSGSKNGLVSGGERHVRIELRPGRSVALGRADLSLEEVSTADGEVCLAIENRRELTPAVHRTTGTFFGAEAASPASALRLIRSIAGGSLVDPVRRDDVLRRAREVLGASYLLISRLDSDEPALVWMAGDPPLEEELLALRELVALRGPRASREDGYFAAHLESLGWLAARVPSAGREGEEWKWELFQYLAERLAGTAPSELRDSEDRDELNFPDGMVIGGSPAFQELLQAVRAAIRSRLDVLLTGETGTGKELITRLLHRSGPRSQGLLVAMNCAAIPRDLLEAELFGVERRVATGVDPRPGRFQQADGGTLFLDEIGELPSSLQAKLLRALQEREVIPLGAASPQRLDLQVISSTNRDLRALCESGAFREDLYFRLAGFEIEVPTLRERREDIPGLLLAFTAAAAERQQKAIAGISSRAIAAACSYSWPGNIRQLAHRVERAVSMTPTGGVVQAKAFDLPQGAEKVPSTLPESTAERRRAPALKKIVADAERQTIREALALVNGNKSHAARALGISRGTLYLKMRRLGMQ